MNELQLNKIYKWFENYAKTFYENDNDILENIILKEQHTYRTSEITKIAAEEIGFKQNEKNIAIASSLLHDVGRFEQFQRFKTFNDPLSVNHAKLGLEIIKKNKILNNLDLKEQRIIQKSIGYHNMINIPDDIENETEKYAMLLRDMDKLDIYYIVLNNYNNQNKNNNVAIERNLDHSEKLNPEILSAFLNHELISYESVKNINDAKLLRLSWLYDLNYDFSIKYLKERDYLNSILDTMPDFEEIEIIRKTIDDYITQY